MIKLETATDIAMAYREIEISEKLLADVLEAMKNHSEPDIRDSFGRKVSGLQLGVPTGPSSHRLFNVSWRMARPIIEAHISEKKAEIAILNEKAITEATND